MMMKKIALCTLSCVSVSACVPTIVMIDRTTLIEEESSGDWPDLDKMTAKKSADFRPEVLPPAAVDKRKERAYQVIDGDYSLSSQSRK